MEKNLEKLESQTELEGFKFIVNPIERYYEGYCFGGSCGTQCQGDCHSNCQGNCAGNR